MGAHNIGGLLRFFVAKLRKRFRQWRSVGGLNPEPPLADRLSDLQKRLQIVLQADAASTARQADPMVPGI